MNPQLQWAIRRSEHLLPVFFLSLFLQTYGQSLSIDARERALGNICSVGDNSLPSTMNPGTLGNIKQVGSSISHAQPFFVRDLGISSLSVFLPAGHGSFRLGTSTVGINDFKIFNWSLNYGLKLGEKLSAGVNFNYSNTMSSGEWNYLWRISPGAGLLYQPTEKTRLGMVINNPVSISNHSGYGPFEPSLIAIGISHETYENTWIMTEVSMNSSGDLCLKGALEYVLKTGPDFRAGFSSNPYLLSFGSGYRWGNVQTDLTFGWTELLGFTPSITISYFPVK